MQAVHPSGLKISSVHCAYSYTTCRRFQQKYGGQGTYQSLNIIQIDGGLSDFVKLYLTQCITMNGDTLYHVIFLEKKNSNNHCCFHNFKWFSFGKTSLQIMENWRPDISGYVENVKKACNVILTKAPAYRQYSCPTVFVAVKHYILYGNKLVHLLLIIL